MKLYKHLGIQGIIGILLFVLYLISPKPWHYYIFTVVLILFLYNAFFWVFAFGYVHTIYLLFLFVGSIIFFGAIYTAVGIVNDSGVVYNDVLTCCYFSLVTFTTLGYGDFRPTESGRILAGIEALLGYIFMALFVATVILKIQKIGKKIKDDDKVTATSKKNN